MTETTLPQYTEGHAPQYTVGTDDQGRFTVMDWCGPVGFPIPGMRYTDKATAEKWAKRFNAIKAGEL